MRENPLYKLLKEKTKGYTAEQIESLEVDSAALLVKDIPNFEGMKELLLRERAAKAEQAKLESIKTKLTEDDIAFLDEKFDIAVNNKSMLEGRV